MLPGVDDEKGQETDASTSWDSNHKLQSGKTT